MTSSVRAVQDQNEENDRDRIPAFLTAPRDRLIEAGGAKFVDVIHEDEGAGIISREPIVGRFEGDGMDFKGDPGPEPELPAPTGRPTVGAAGGTGGVEVAPRDPGEIENYMNDALGDLDQVLSKNRALLEEVRANRQDYARQAAELERYDTEAQRQERVIKKCIRAAEFARAQLYSDLSEED